MMDAGARWRSTQRRSVQRARAITATVASIAAAALVALAATPSIAEPKHGISTFGELKYPADFKHFDYVNPDAPKGGRLSRIGSRGLVTFDSFNGYILKGDAAQGLSILFEGFSLVFDSLMTPATDEPNAVYGLVAESADLADDRKSITFKLRPEAKFADGTALTAEDVKFSIETLKTKGHPNLRNILRNVAEITIINPHEIRFKFEGEQVRDLPVNIATQPIFSKAYYADREFDQTSLDRPLGSGPYKIGRFDQGRFVEYERREDYWAKDLPVNVGRHNFDVVRFEYYRERSRELEDLKSGTFDLREEFTSKDWATGYNIAAVKDGRLQRLTMPDGRAAGAQGFFFNMRRDKFKDIRVRRALGLAFDFEWTNKNLFYSLYKRTRSYFQNSAMVAEGPASDEERALLKPFEGQFDKALLEAPADPPVSDGSGTDRKLLREAVRLLDEAGFKRQGAGRVTPDGKPFTIEFLLFSPSFERIILPYIENLKRIGVQAAIRRVDVAQFQRRMKSFDFDVLTQRFVVPATPGVGLRTTFGSEAAKIEGSFNLAGISDPVVDALIEKVVDAKSRDELNVAMRALDRVLRSNHYWVPQWYKAAHNLAFWDRFGRPETKPKFATGIIDTWWYDADKAAKLAQN
ncbi:MAG: extracellular solute-binding protein [Pseudomonadota bacterium]